MWRRKAAYRRYVCSEETTHDYLILPDFCLNVTHFVCLPASCKSTGNIFFMRLSVRLAYCSLLPFRSFVPLASRPRPLSKPLAPIPRIPQSSPTRPYATVMNPVKRTTDDLEKPDLDDRSYRVIELSNKLEALIVHDAQTDKASASLNVNVGNFCDEEDMPGMAHAVEHLLFMGTEKVHYDCSHHSFVSEC